MPTSAAVRPNYRPGSYLTGFGSTRRTGSAAEPDWVGAEINDQAKATVGGIEYEAQRTALESGWMPISRDGESVRFEVRSGFFWSSDGADYERSELDGYARELGQTAAFEVNYTLKILPGAESTAAWCLMGQLHQSTETGFSGWSPPLCWTLDGLDLKLEARTSTANPILSNPDPEQLYSFAPERGRTYSVRMELKPDPTGADGYIRVWINGAQVVDRSAYAWGYYSDHNYWKFGIYREAAPQTMAAIFGGMSVALTLPAGDWLDETTALASRMATPPTAARMALIDGTIALLKDGSAGESPAWDKIDTFAAFAAADSQAALLNWKGTSFAPTNYLATFTADVGFAGNGTAALIDSNYNPTTAGGQYVQNSATIAGWKLESAQEAKGFMGEGASTYLYPRYTDDNLYYKMNVAADGSAASTDGSGFWLMSRTASNALRVERNGVSMHTRTDVSIAPANDNLYWLYSGDYSAHTIQMGVIAAGLTASEAQTVYDACAYYMAGL